MGKRLFRFAALLGPVWGLLLLTAPAGANDNRSMPPHCRAAGDPATIACTVQSGDTLGRLLRRTGAVHEQLIFSAQTLAALQRANPEISDFGALQPGAVITIPLGDIVDLKAGRAIPASPAKKHKALPAQARPQEGTGQQDPAFEIIASDDEDPGIREQSVFDAGPGQSQAHRLISGMTRYFGGLDNTTCRKRFALDQSGSFTLDCTKNPVYEFPWGKTIVLDYGSSVPGALHEILKAAWPDASILSVGQSEQPASVLGRAIDAAGLQRVSSSQKSVINHNDVQLTVMGGHIVFYENNPGNMHLIAPSPPLPLPACLRDYLTEMGVTVADLYSPALPATGCSQPECAPIETPETRGDPAGVTDIILGLNGIRYQKNVKTKLIPRTASGIILEMTSDRKFMRAGKTHFILFKHVSENIAHLFETQGYKIFRIDRTKRADFEFIQNLFAFCGISYVSPQVSLQYDYPDTTLMISFPGLLAQTSTGKILFTNVNLDKKLLSILDTLSIKVYYF